MRRILSIILMSALALALLTSAIARPKKEKQFRGTITYSISYESSALTSQQISSFPTSQAIKMFDGMTLYDQKNPQGNIRVISNPKTDQNMVLLQSGEKKAALITSYKESIAKQDSAKEFTTEIDFSNDTKVIAGFKCNKATVTFTPIKGVEAEERMFSVYYSSKLGGLKSNIGGPYEGINGELLEFYDVNTTIITKMVATEIIKGKVKEGDFDLAEDYKVFDNQEGLIKYFQGI